MVGSIDTPAVQKIVSRQMQQWSSAQRAADERRHPGPHPAPTTPLWITLSREPGAGARELAEKLRQRLGLSVYGRELLDRMAEGHPLERDALERVETGPHDALREAVQMSLDRAYPGHHSYLKRLVAIGSSLAARGGVVLIGRGLHLVLPQDQGLRVRLVASREFRIRRVMNEFGHDMRDAERWIDETDASQNELVRRMLHRDLRDVHDYDMVLDTERLGLDVCADVVAAGLGAKRRSLATVG